MLKITRENLLNLITKIYNNVYNQSWLILHLARNYKNG